MFERIKIFLKESREEWGHVNWPSRNEVLYLTGVVIAFSLIIALFLGLCDAFLIRLLEIFVTD